MGKTSKMIEQADISFRSPKLTKIMMIMWYIIAAAALILTSLPEEKFDGYCIDYHFMTYTVATKYLEPGRWHNAGELEWDNVLWMFIPIALAILIIVFVVPLCLYLSNFNAKRCNLSLWEDTIQGNLKTAFSVKELRLPIEKVDNVMVVDGFADKIRGGKTIVIRSNSGLIKFHWVHNADAFVRATVQQIEEFKKQTAAASTPAPAAASSASLTEKLQELQTLRDQGILTEEQFEQKKQELLAKF